MTVWHYNLKGTPTGPTSAEGIANLYTNGTIDEDTLVWNAERGGAWTRLDQVPELRALRTSPALPASAVSDVWVWAMVAVPVIGTLAEVVVSESSGASISLRAALFFYFIAYGTLAALDTCAIAKSGRTKKVGTIGPFILLVPVYLFVRTQRLKKSFAVLAFWAVSTVIAGFIPSGFISQYLYIGRLPSCSSQASIAQVKDLFPSLPIKIENIEAISLNDIETVLSETNKKACYASIFATDGNSYPVTYTIEEKGEQLLYLLNIGT